MIQDPLLLTRIKGLVRSNRLRFLYLLLAELAGARHSIVRIDPAMACNLRCRMCHFSDDSWRAAHAGKIAPERLRRVADELFPTALQVHVGCSAEPTTYRDYPEIVGLAKAKGVPFVSLVTNGQLLTAADFDRLVGHGLDEIVLSVHGTRRKTYERLMAGASFDRLVEALALASRGGPRLRVNYTANPGNLDELADFFRIFGGFAVKVLQVRPVIDIAEARYHEGGLDTVAGRYREVMNRLRAECGARGVALLANLADPGYQGANADAAAYLSVLRIVSPTMVWRPDFDIDAIGYAAFKRRIGYRRELLRGILSGAPAPANQPLASSGLL